MARPWWHRRCLTSGRRHSVDFDFFGNQPFDPAKLAAIIPFMAATITQREPNTLTGMVERGGRVKISFSGFPICPAYSRRT